MDGGLITLLPAVIVIVFAIVTRKTFESLLLGAFVCCMIAAGKGCITAFIDLICKAISDIDVMWIVLVSVLFGSLIRLLRESRATWAFANIAKRYATTGKKSLLITWVMGIVLFIDDYLSIMTTANTMMETCDRKKIPREMLAYVLDSTSAPVCVIIPISAWVVYFSGIFEAQPETDYLGQGMAAYYSAMPWMFYAWICVLIVPLVILGIIPRLGPMKKAWKRAEEENKPYSDYSKKFNQELSEVDTEGKIKVWHFLLPILTVVVITLLIEDILYGVIGGIVMCGILFLPFRILSFDHFSDSVIGGMQDMIWMAVLIVSGATLRYGVNEINMPQFVIDAVSPYMSAALLPVIVFLTVAVLAFVTSGIWALPAVITPIVLPLAAAVGTSIPMTMGAIISGAVFGAHACFYADVTVLTSGAAKIDNMEHCLTQLPYCLLGGTIAAIGFLAAGLALA
ncbi:MAG: Na+/H+ antiporter NhaC family protein [Clostridiales Family XIII bacterium]|nr:sodium:proton antiporter [Clostridia bacterium]MDE8734391.1 Na+/H+ antiporter NhaC family protein [Eubacteriales bacterium DFI.9.88]MDY3010106.1 Na+/H+ antiporter NhaC family protein [Clostridiales Family XIII bacterium]